MPKTINHPATQVLAPLPAWARGDPPVTETEAAFAAGAVLAILDSRVREPRSATINRTLSTAITLARDDTPSVAGVWRQRLALKAAAVSAKILRRAEDEAALRDAFFLRSGDGPAGPAGRLLLAWRGLNAPHRSTMMLFVTLPAS